jgi:hypothetical protein
MTRWQMTLANCKLDGGPYRHCHLPCSRRISVLPENMMFLSTIALLLATATAFYVQPSVKISSMRGLMMNNAERTYM